MADNYEYMARGWTRHEAFADILRRYPPRREYRRGDIVVLEVRFGVKDNTYCYRSPDNIYKAGDLVEVSVRGESRFVEVVAVGYYSQAEYPFTNVHLNTIIGPAKGDLAEKYRQAIEEEKRKEFTQEELRAEAKQMLEEARMMKLEAREEKDAADRERQQAAREREKAAAIREEAKEDRAEAATDREEAARQLEEAARILEETKKAREATKKLTEEMVIAGEEARKENERLEAAVKEARKVWKRRRPETSDPTILRLRKVQDALDEDEEIYRGISALEEKIEKVIARAEEIKTEGDIRRLHEFYLPTTADVMEQFRNIFSSGLPPASVGKLRDDVLETIEKSNEVYNNILEDLYLSDMLELQSELDALQTMFAINGLLDSDFEIEK
ncbi:MAG: hypothetical protein IJ132_05470 [Firmicutes bacterium]|nr:hypothetical protein [Bacillota bacterium]